MELRCIACVIAVIAWGAAIPSAHADPKADIAAKARSAMASYDAMDYDVARRLLHQALAIAKKAKLEKDPIVARVYLELGIAQLASADTEAAKVSLLSAVLIDPKIAIDPAYKSPELSRLLEEARAAAAEATGEAAPETAAAVDCRAVRGLQHAVVDLARAGEALAVEAAIGDELAPARVVAMYRPEGAIDFVEARLTRQDGCRYTGAIPSSATRGSVLHYYLVAYDASQRVLASRGSSGNPNAVALARGGEGDEARVTRPLPLSASEPVARAAQVEGPRSAQTVSLSIAGGTGFGYVTGLTEAGNKVQSCCIGTSLAVVTPELAYHATAKLSIGVAVRIGLPIGANIMGHATTSPGVLVRLRHRFSSTGHGLRVMAEVGGGLLRNTIKLDTDEPGMDTDIVAQGPLLVGAGIGYSRKLAGSVSWFIDLDAIAGIAVVGKVGSVTRLNSGVSGDLSLGLAVGF